MSRGNEDLVEQLTWLRLREALDEDRGILPALQLYLAAIRNIGAGTGLVRAPRYRADAREAMVKASEAVRCWIMPHWRVSETLPAELASFDLVILDEASQSDAWAIPALLRAKKLLVVGDHKQVSPTSFVKESDVRLLQQRFLRKLPFGAAMAPEKSAYDLAKVIFASDLVALREHFRCVEPIIEFSNQLCYNGEIRCLRVPTSEERLSPVLVDVFVRGGYRHAGSQKINRPEAEAIVEEIKKIVANPSMRHRSIGVVSLLGNEQARLVLDLLIVAIGERAILDHQIRCGDAMTFQGREADIMFISMVSDAGSLRAATGEMYEQRFNVAASRARDRMYLFRSFRREDVSDYDLRARLLDHFTRPLRQDTMQVQSQREHCESGFERAVFDELAQRNYRVLAQVPAGGYRIDLVVEGHHGRRLAIECDGDQYHTPEDWLADISRQRALERIGWIFWRCWGSSYIRDPAGCLDDLLARLKELAIDPIGSAEIDLSGITEYREIAPAGPEDEADDSEREESVEEQSAEVPPRLEHVLRWSQAERQSTQPAAGVPAQPELQKPQQEILTDPVQVGDSVGFIFMDDPADEIWVLITAEASHPKLGLINVDTPLARALLGAQATSEVSADLPGGSRKLQILHIHKPRRVSSQTDGVTKAGLLNVAPSTHTNNLPPRREGLRHMEIEVTQGMINQNLLVLTEWVNRGFVNVGETLAIECLPSGERFSTDLIEQGKKLRERGAVGRFYAAARVRAGDRVRLSEFAPRRWKLVPRIIS